MQDDLAVSCRDVVKRFYARRPGPWSLSDLLAMARRSGRSAQGRHDFALSDINLAVRRGESVAVIGANSSGKSSLLRLIAGVYPPTSGQITTRGRVAPVLQLGAGFHPQLTGRENVVLYATLLGFRRDEIAACFDDIVEFSGAADLIDLEIRYYSSGMRARLAFAVAAHADPDILLIDEVLAVGDASFRNRCMKRLQTFHESGGTLLIVSHNTQILKRLCGRGVWLDSGRIRLQGRIDEIVEAYEAAFEAVPELSRQPERAGA